MSHFFIEMSVYFGNLAQMQLAFEMHTRVLTMFYCESLKREILSEGCVYVRVCACVRVCMLCTAMGGQQVAQHHEARFIYIYSNLVTIW